MQSRSHLNEVLLTSSSAAVLSSSRSKIGKSSIRHQLLTGGSCQAFGIEPIFRFQLPLDVGNSLPRPAYAGISNAEHRVAVAIVVNRSQKIGDMSLQEVRKLFLGEKGTLPNGRRVSLLMSPTGTPEREAVLRQIYRMSESEFTKYVLQSVFTGRQSPPREVASSEMKKVVAENPDVIGYLTVTQVDDTLRAVLVLQ